MKTIEFEPVFTRSGGIAEWEVVMRTANEAGDPISKVEISDFVEGILSQQLCFLAGQTLPVREAKKEKIGSYFDPWNMREIPIYTHSGIDRKAIFTFMSDESQNWGMRL